MKKSLSLVILLLLLCPAMAQRRLNTKKQMNLDIETFDFNKYPREESGYPFFQGTLKDGTDIYVYQSDFDIVLAQTSPPYYFATRKLFNKEGKLKEKGVQIDGCRIKKWLICDENGDNCKVVDYEKDRGRFSYNDVLKFLEKNKYLNPRVKKPEDEKSFGLEYSYEQNTWEIKVSKAKDVFGCYVYILDGNSGKVLKKEYVFTMF